MSEHLVDTAICFRVRRSGANIFQVGGKSHPDRYQRTRDGQFLVSLVATLSAVANLLAGPTTLDPHPVNLSFHGGGESLSPVLAS